MYKRFFVSVFLVSPLLLTPQYLWAAELLFKVAPDQKTIEVWVDPQSKEMNVVEGTIQFSGFASEGLLAQVENGQSILPVWPTPPLYDEDNKAIEFVGGVPNGFNVEGLLFRVKLSPAMSGDLIVAYEDGAGYLNDGNGTKEVITSEPLKMTMRGEGESEMGKDLSGPTTFTYATIILLIGVIGFVIFRYVFKRNHKQ